MLLQYLLKKPASPKQRTRALGSFPRTFPTRIIRTSFFGIDSAVAADSTKLTLSVLDAQGNVLAEGLTVSAENHDIYKDGSKICHIIKTPGVAAKDFADVLTINVYYDGSAEPVESITYSVAEYFLERLYKNGVVNATEGKELSQKKLYKASMRYGAAAQKVLSPDDAVKITNYVPAILAPDGSATFENLVISDKDIGATAVEKYLAIDGAVDGVDNVYMQINKNSTGQNQPIYRIYNTTGAEATDTVVFEAKFRAQDVISLNSIDMTLRSGGTRVYRFYFDITTTKGLKNVGFNGQPSGNVGVDGVDFSEWVTIRIEYTATADEYNAEDLCARAWVNGVELDIAHNKAYTEQKGAVIVYGKASEIDNAAIILTSTNTGVLDVDDMYFGHKSAE